MSVILCRVDGTGSPAYGAGTGFQQGGSRAVYAARDDTVWNHSRFFDDEKAGGLKPRRSP